MILQEAAQDSEDLLKNLVSGGRQRGQAKGFSLKGMTYNLCVYCTSPIIFEDI
jgi:hypothetical protein